MTYQARKVALPAEYAVFHTDYTGRFEQTPLRERLYDELINSEIPGEPLYVYDTQLGQVEGSGLTMLSPEYRARVDRENVAHKAEFGESLVVMDYLGNKQLTDVEVNRIQEVLQQVSPDLSDGIIVFRVQSMDEIFRLYEVLHELDYCHICGIGGLEYVEVSSDRGTTGMAIVNVMSESG
jgi:hypothetical protein